ncbi:MAG TPA: histidine kinase dimerization/phosphoacceptor domain -containing protein [Allosphingosinicella sp.]|uniref:sensor histidine kinase n=1 Tax=Allosphingosinicella sp. TaxID=2823234 RepID=UPI002ED91DD7
MNRETEKSARASRFSELSTGQKMLLILSAGLLPLAALAMLASLQNAREDAQRRSQDVQTRVELKAQRLYWTLSRAAFTMRAANATLAELSAGSVNCDTAIRRLSDMQIVPGRYVLYAGQDRPLCASPGFTPSPDLLQYKGQRSAVRISDDAQWLSFALFDAEGRIEGAGQLARPALSDLTYIPGTNPTFDLTLTDGQRSMVLRDQFKDGPLVQTVRAVAPLAGGRLQLRIALAATPLTFSEFLMTALPLLMWLFSAAIVWFIVDRLLVRPLKRMQYAVAAYRPGDEGLDLPRSRTPANEIRELGAAFDRVTRTIASHEAELEAAVERQTRLVREVHHRVKNNLQVVASLLNLHARGATNEEVSAAYASIQRRVDALAVVHRNHYAELEENRGVSLRSLISELCANLRATAPQTATGMAIRLDVEPYYATQDVAVSVAFLVTEIIEYAMFCGGKSVTVTLAGGDKGTARLALESDALKAEVKCDEALTDRFTRIVTGLSRQLRSAIERDEENGRYALDIAVVDKLER